MVIKVDNYTRVVLTVIAVLLSLLTVGLWFETPGKVERVAEGAIPDGGLQRKLILEEAVKTNRLLVDLRDLLRSGDVKVQVVESSKVDDEAEKSGDNSGKLILKR